MGDAVVTIKQGTLRGEKVESATGGSYLSFKGVPYAAPPIGDLRFKDPQPPATWIGIRDALVEGPVSLQTDVLTKAIIGDEDCLYLNVTTTSLTGSRPVMIYIHGGGFYFGNGGFDMCGPDYLMDADIVYVSMNYRLGVLGFLNLDHEVVSGNMGLKDQVAAFEWVKENIAQFGGDPNNVTIFGESAGGASIHFHLLSPLAKGLFHKAIMHSGVVLNPFAINWRAAGVAHRYVATLGKDITDPNEIVEYLRTIPFHRLLEVQRTFPTSEDHLNLVFPFGPCVDDKSSRPFMLKRCEELAKKGFDVPVVIGHNRCEALFLLCTEVFRSTMLQEDTFPDLDESFRMVMPRDLTWKVPSKIAEIEREIKKFYFGDEKITHHSFGEYVRCYGDMHFNVGVHRVVEIQRGKKSPTYFYRFSYDSPNSIHKALFQIKEKGATHMDELQYLLHPGKARAILKMEIEPADQVMRDKMVRMWTDFAKTGNPTPVIDDLITDEWKPVTKTTKNYFEIDTELRAGVYPDEEMYETWKRVYAMAED